MSENKGIIGAAEHVAIIMDGNGRWGLKKFNSRRFGHRMGIKTVEKNGGIDNYLLGLKNSKLNDETKKLKKAITNKKS